MKKIAVILSGCGFKDGAAITEAVSTLIQLSQHGADYQIFAPNIEFPSLNHIDDSDTGSRNVLVESSRIARGNISDLAILDSKKFDALVFPGGFGVAKNLCTWATDGSNCKVNELVSKNIKEFYDQSKPIGAICIAPALVGKVLGEHEPTMTLGSDPATAEEFEKTGAQHENCSVSDYVTDREHKIVSTPAYMYGEAKPHEVFKGISGLIKEVYEMA